MNFEDRLKALGTRYALAALYVFGSRAAEIISHIRGQGVSPEFPEADVDIGVQPVFGRRLTAAERVRLALDLEDLLAAKPVDLVLLPEAVHFWPWMSFEGSCSTPPIPIRRQRKSCTSSGVLRIFRTMPVSGGG